MPTIRDIIARDGRIFIKSEWGPISDEWPVLSFSKRNVGDRLRAEYNPDSDIVLYVGTGGESTRDPNHRKRLLSAVKAEPNVIRQTRDLVPPASWANAVNRHGERWEFSFATLRAWDIPSLPVAPDVIPETYSSLAKPENWGNVVEVLANERSGLLDIQVVEIHLAIQKAGTAFAPQRQLMSLDDATKNEIGRMVMLIRQREARSGATSGRINPIRIADTQLSSIFWDKVRAQDFRCGLCGAPLVAGQANKLLQWSGDRIASSNPTYDAVNLHVTHLGCNLAKSDATMKEFEDWITVVRGTTEPEQ